ncbi:MAG TPA: outer membrane protein transport protein [Verrucomicrobiae bacterium]|nr:outer membrane protein transport protein [Verrucomicrobiae bacterium]
MKINRKTQVAASAALLLVSVVVVPSTVFGLGLALPDQDAFATARGNAFAATANDPAAIFYNPAGMSQLDGANVSLGAYGIMLSDRYTSRGTGIGSPFPPGAPSGESSVNSKTIWSAVPHFFSTYTLPKLPLSFGLGVYSPYGLRMEWPNTAPFLAAGETAQLTYLTGAAMVSWQIMPTLSIAAGPTFNYSEADLKEFVPVAPGFGFVNHFRGHATDAGYTAGLLFQAAEHHFFGLTYRSATEMNYNGHATVPAFPFQANTGASADFHFPYTLVFGYSFRPSDKWNFESDINWTDWSHLKTVPLEPSPPLPAADTLAFNWKPSWMLDFGVTRYLGDDWRISGGYMYSENSVPDGNFNPLIPDSDRHIFSLGVGKKFGKFSWDAAYQLAWGPSRSVGSDATAFGLPDGKYAFLSHALTINVGYHF